eukprot:COSAG02_NODE_6295_length_3670_cov_24.413107_1_plen_65_part_10
MLDFEANSKFSERPKLAVSLLASTVSSVLTSVPVRRSTSRFSTAVAAFGLWILDCSPFLPASVQY